MQIRNPAVVNDTWDKLFAGYWAREDTRSPMSTTKQQHVLREYLPYSVPVYCSYIPRLMIFLRTENIVKTS